MKLDQNKQMELNRAVDIAVRNFVKDSEPISPIYHLGIAMYILERSIKTLSLMGLNTPARQFVAGMRELCDHLDMEVIKND